MEFRKIQSQSNMSLSFSIIRSCNAVEDVLIRVHAVRTHKLIYR